MCTRNHYLALNFRKYKKEKVSALSRKSRKHIGTNEAASKGNRSQLLLKFIEISQRPVAGIDVHKLFFNICVIEPIVETTKKSVKVRYHHKNFPRNETGLQSAPKFLKTFDVQLIAIESTSIYHQIVVNTLQKESFTVLLVNAGLIAPRSRRAPKADKLDARKLAELVFRGELSPTGAYRPSYITMEPLEQQLRMTLRLRDKLVHDRIRLYNRTHKVFDQFAINLKKELSKSPFSDKWVFVMRALAYEVPMTKILEAIKLSEKDIKKTQQLKDKFAFYFGEVDKIMLQTLCDQITNISQTIKRLERRINEHKTELSYTLLRRFEIAKSLPGVAEELGIRIVIEYGDPFRFTNRRKAGRYTGLDAVIRSSGGKASLGKISKSGNKYLRRALFIAASNAVRYDRNFRLYYHKMKKYRKVKHNQIICSVARKLGVLYCSLVKKDELYHPNKYRIKYNIHEFRR
jgi:transposase